MSSIQIPACVVGVPEALRIRIADAVARVIYVPSVGGVASIVVALFIVRALVSSSPFPNV
jgi:hypothetical protein